MFLIDLKAPWLDTKMVGVADGAVHLVRKKVWCEYRGRRYLVGASAFDHRIDADIKRLKACQQLLRSHLYHHDRSRGLLTEAIIKLKAEVNGVNH